MNTDEPCRLKLASFSVGVEIDHIILQPLCYNAESDDLSHASKSYKGCIHATAVFFFTLSCKCNYNAKYSWRVRLLHLCTYKRMYLKNHQQFWSDFHILHSPIPSLSNGAGFTLLSGGEQKCAKKICTMSYAWSSCPNTAASPGKAVRGRRLFCQRFL